MASTASGTRLTAAHRQTQLRIVDTVADLVEQTWPLLDPRAVQATAARWADVVLPIVLDGYQRSAATSATYLRAFGQVEAGIDLAALVAQVEAETRAAAATSLRVTGPVALTSLQAAGHAPEAALATARTLVLGAIKRHVLNGGRDTLVRTISSDPRVGGWRRVGDGSTCKFCRMLIGRGEVYRAETARFAAHDNCGCMAEPAFGGKPATVLQYTASKRVQTEADRARVRAFLADMDD